MSDSKKPASQFQGGDNKAFEAYIRNPSAAFIEIQAFFAQLESDEHKAELKKALPADVSVESFIKTTKTALQNNPKLLYPAWRRSLFVALAKAARQGIPPDGRQGALVPRKNEANGNYEICWQPMVWGIIQAGRRTGAIKNITARLVYEGEPYRFLTGDDERIEHEQIFECMGEGLAKCRGGYAIFEGVNGEKTRRALDRTYILKVKASSKAQHGPWHGPFEPEMWVKTILLSTAKWIDTDAATVKPEAMARWREALETDMESDLGDEEALALGTAPSVPALTDETKINALADQVAAKINQQPAEKAAVEAQREERPVEAQRTQGGAVQEQQQAAGDNLVQPAGETNPWFVPMPRKDDGKTGDAAKYWPALSSKMQVVSNEDEMEQFVVANLPLWKKFPVPHRNSAKGALEARCKALGIQVPALMAMLFMETQAAEKPKQEASPERRGALALFNRMSAAAKQQADGDGLAGLLADENFKGSLEWLRENHADLAQDFDLMLDDLRQNSAAKEAA